MLFDIAQYYYSEMTGFQPATPGLSLRILSKLTGMGKGGPQFTHLKTGKIKKYSLSFDYQQRKVPIWRLQLGVLEVAGSFLTSVLPQADQGDFWDHSQICK